MARRQFKDESGVPWDVWDVHPGEALAPAPYDRRSPVREDDAGTPAIASAPMLSPELELGWLCFQTGAERRRFAPIPVNWTELPDPVLRVMLGIASPAGQSTDDPSHPAATEPRSSPAG